MAFWNFGTGETFCKRVSGPHKGHATYIGRDGKEVRVRPGSELEKRFHELREQARKAIK